MTDAARATKPAAALLELWARAGQGGDLARFARFHGMLPFLYASELASKRQTSSRVRESVQRDVEYHQRRCLRLTGEALAILEALERSGVPALGLKGPFLAQRLYGSVAMRHFRDVDILVPPDRLLPAARVLQAIGYAPSLPGMLATRASRAFLMRIDNHLGFIRGEDLVELHWRLGLRRLHPRRDAELWDCLGVERLWDRTIRAMRAEDLLQFLCGHGMKHLWQRLEWIVDVGTLLELDPPVDVAVVARRTNRLEARRALAVGLLLARDVYGAALPPSVDEWLASDDEAAAISDRIVRTMLSGASSPTSPLQVVRTRIAIEPRLRMKARHAWEALTMPSVRDWNACPSATLPFAFHRGLATFRRLMWCVALPLRRFAVLEPAQSGLLLRAFVALARARIALYVAPARALRNLAPDSPAAQALPVASAAEPILQAVRRAGRWVPGGTRCLVSALAAQRLLHHDGHAATIMIGVRAGSRFDAHAWIDTCCRRSGSVGESEGYTPIARVRPGEGYDTLRP